MQPASQRPLVRAALDATAPAGGGAVMGTGIVSVALLLTGHEGISRALLWIAAAIWVVLALSLALRVVIDRPRLRGEVRLPTSLTGVAGTAVLGARLTLHGWSWAGVVALCLGGVLVVALMIPVVLHMGRAVAGGAFLVTVAVESLAELSAVVAVDRGSAPLATLAVVLAVVGLATYPWVLMRFDFAQIVRGAGDHWVTGGALAISALAFDGCAAAVRATGATGGLPSTLDVVATVIMVAALLWLPPLVAGEILRPRLRYDVRRWATVFPLGMYAAAAFQTGAGDGRRPLINAADLWVWVALVVWALVAVAAARHAVELMRGARRPAPR